MSELKTKILSKMQPPTLASLATIHSDGKPWTRYVVVMADASLTVWFATFTGSRKTEQIAAHPEVHLTLGVADMASAESYIQIEGRAEILHDAETKKAIWYDHLANIFSGPDDPKFCVGKVIPYRIEYNTMDPAKAVEVWEA